MVADISRVASIMQDHAKNTVSDKYTFIPTTRVVDVLAQKGWYPAIAHEAWAKLENRGFQKHMVRFRQEGANSVVAIDRVIPEIVVTNSHGGASSFQLMAGLFRFICLNGMVVADSTFAKHTIKHLGYADIQVLDAVDMMINTTPRITARVHDFQQIELTKDEQQVYAMASLLVKYGEEEMERRVFDTDQLLRPRRVEDQEPTLWATYNRIQEKMIQGGSQYERSKKNGKLGPRQRKVSSVTEDVRINQGLWLITEHMAKVKGAILQ